MNSMLSWTRCTLGVLLACALLFFAGFASAEIGLTLNKSFIEKYKNRATIEDECVVDKTKGKANSQKKDGDMHIAVRCNREVALAMVAELMNAREYPDVIKATVESMESGAPIRIAGAWRIWNEHGGDTGFTQGKTVLKADTTNPDHVFEIHPVTAFGDKQVLDSFKPIAGFTPKEADRAFPMYESVRAKISPHKTTTTITSNGIGYNYVDFQMELNEKVLPVSDGSLAFAKVRDAEGHLLLRKKRMVFVKDTPPERAIREAKVGDCFRVLGIPRLDLALVSWRTREAAKGRSEVLSWNLPYEIIVVGMYEGTCETD